MFVYCYVNEYILWGKLVINGFLVFGRDKKKDRVGVGKKLIFLIEIFYYREFLKVWFFFLLIIVG